MEEQIRKIYTNASSPASFSSPIRVYAEARRRGIKVTLRRVKSILTRFASFTMNKEIRERFPKRKVMSFFPGDSLSIDLLSMVSLARHNRQYKYILTVVDNYSLKIWCELMKRKTPAVSSVAMTKILDKMALEGITPYSANCDRGGEFSQSFLQALKDRGIVYFFSQNANKSLMVENRIKVLKMKIYRYMNEFQTKVWYDQLTGFVQSINEAKNSRTGISPNEAMGSIRRSLTLRRHAPYLVKMRAIPLASKPTPISLHTFVRIPRKGTKSVTRRSYTENFSESLYRVVEVLQTIPPTYKIADLDGTVLKRRYYSYELSIVHPSMGDYRRFKKLTRRTRKGVKEVKVKFLDNGEETWLKESSVIFTK